VSNRTQLRPTMSYVTLGSAALAWAWRSLPWCTAEVKRIQSESPWHHWRFLRYGSDPSEVCLSYVTTAYFHNICS